MCFTWVVFVDFWESRSVSVEELAVHFPGLAQEVFKYIFSIGEARLGG